MAKQQNSYSENIVRRIRHSRKYQVMSIVLVAVGLLGILMISPAVAPTNYGEDVGRQTVPVRGEGFRDKVSLKLGDVFNRLAFVAGRQNDKPEWVVPVNLPAPPEQVRTSLPDRSTFGDVTVQSVAADSQEVPDTTDGVAQTTPAQPVTATGDQSSENTSPADDEDFGETYGEIFDVKEKDLSKINICVYEREA